MGLEKYESRLSELEEEIQDYLAVEMTGAPPTASRICEELKKLWRAINAIRIDMLDEMGELQEGE